MEPAGSCRRKLAGILLAVAAGSLRAEIPRPTDAPKPLSPAEAARSFHLPAGFRIELAASEPLITEPSGVCWDERGRLYVSELHGYNLEGQLEIEEMNKSGVLDTKVQRVQAAEKFKKAAEAGTYGIVKILHDTDGDGLMDRADVLAADLPPAYGLCPARGGVIVACAPDIVFLADPDGDGRAEVREKLFTGFRTGALERGINCPQWGPDGWIYFGRGWGGGKISGPRLREPMELPNSDFRIRPDGSAIEPVTGGTHTFGFAFTSEGDRFVVTTWKHALYAAPIPWRYLTRNPDAAMPGLEADAADYTTVFPVSPVHPWKISRSNDPGWKELYGEYGVSESAASGYFTSCCSPLVVQDAAFPESFRGNLLACEPAQNLVHRSVIERDGPALRVRRAPGEEKKEFLASTDSWFRPMALAHGPDGAVWIVDMYREIIEDYSAVPRFMQQQYGVTNGHDRGRIWRLSHESAPRTAATGMERLDASGLARELESPRFWRRQTAERLLRERYGDDTPALATRRGNLLELSGATPAARAIEILRARDETLKTDAEAARRLLRLVEDSKDPRLLLQLALSLGYSREPAALEGLIRLARRHGHIRWMAPAILTGLHERAGTVLAALVDDPGPEGAALLESLAASIAARRDAVELADGFASIARGRSPAVRAACLKGFKSALKPGPLADRGRTALETLLKDDDLAVRGLAGGLAMVLKPGDGKALAQAAAQAAEDSRNVRLPTERRLAAVSLLAAWDDGAVSRHLLAAWASGTPVLRAAVVDAFLLRRERMVSLVEAIEDGTLPASTLAYGQRTRVLERADSHMRSRFEAAFAAAARPDFEATYRRYAAALGGPRDPRRGGELFRKLCATCHRVKEEGTAVGPDLSVAFQRADETLLRDILAPSDAVTSSYETYTVSTRTGELLSGVLAGDSATSVTLRQAAGEERTVLRKDIAQLSTSPVSLMPDGLADSLSPKDCADLIAWLRASLRGSP